MTEIVSTNLFATSLTVTQLFDALWHRATAAVIEEYAGAKLEDRPFDGKNIQRARELAIVDAHKRYAELTESTP